MREKILFDDNWLFHKGDLPRTPPRAKGPVYMQAKTERMKWGPACKNYRAVIDDFGFDAELTTDWWEKVNLPHDYIISQAPDETENGTLGFFKYENAWYRKVFRLSPDDAGKRITLLFEGVAVHAEVYLNGALLKRNFCGYTSFEVDLTDMVKYTGDNVLAVYVKTQDHEGWWYEGGGIYRHVWLMKTSLLSVDLWGDYAAPKKTDDNLWRVDFETTVRNDSPADESVTAEAILIDHAGNLVARANAAALVARQKKEVLRYSVEVREPHLWNLDDPYLYQVKTMLTVRGESIDETATRIGFRTVVADAEKGLFLNGNHVKIKGVCAHGDYGLTGKAVPDNLHRYRAFLLKEMGANGMRTAHYPHAESFMDALDEMGFLVMDETRWFESSEEGLAQLEMLVKRDRNRPSVIFWSIGNEEPHHITEEGRRIAAKMAAHIRKYDTTRIITTAVSIEPEKATVYTELDAIGINYNLASFDKLHKAFPDLPIVSSECCATGTTRGWYLEDSPTRGYLNAVDKDTNEWFLGREKTWKFMTERDYILGSYQWTAFEHRGESVWPRLCSQSGAIDLFLQKKDAFFQNKSHWVNEPMVHLLPHWNHTGLEGEPIRVVAYTNCERLELFLNGESIGEKEIERFGHGEWMVPYVPGKIEVRGLIGEKEVAFDSRETTGRAVKLNLRLDNTPPAANGKDIAIVTCFATDREGRTVPDASPLVRFDTNSFGKIVGTGSDVCDHTPVPCVDRTMRAGLATAAVLVGNKEGVLKVYAESEGHTGAVLSIAIAKKVE